MISYADSEDHAARTAVTRAVITDFARLFYVERHVRTAFETFVAPGYIQHYHGDQRGGAVMDLYRVAGGKIVEHWDVIQPIPETAHNDHPLL
jgi:predicted SnoaL-like aldol condensation-catalyzing enzyme